MISEKQTLLFKEEFGINNNGAIEVTSFPLDLTEKVRNKVFTFKPEIAREVTGVTHGIHVYPAKFIPQIPRWSFDLAKLKPGAAILDPFCGSGTTLVEGFLRDYVCYGTDINPLARLLTKVKTTPLPTTDFHVLNRYISRLIETCRADSERIELDTTPESLNLHRNWRFWFPGELMGDVLKVKKNILSFNTGTAHHNSVIFRNLFLVVFSSIVRKISLFDERQIKVRLHKNKFKNGFPDVIGVFEEALRKAIPGLISLSESAKKLIHAKALVIGELSQNIPLKSESIDHMVTSPPYLNAIDYPMAHKYSLFLLDLIAPDDFFKHCREYIGLTERAVRRCHLDEIHDVGVNKIDTLVNALRLSENMVDNVRAYIVYRYFADMLGSLREFHRVLRPRAFCIIVVGDNVIRGRYVPTHLLVKELACMVGFKCQTAFFHQLRNIRLKVNRNVTGGKIGKELVLILRK